MTTRPRPARPLLQIEVLWGDTLLASELAPAPARVAAVVRRGNGGALPAAWQDLRAEIDAAGAPRLRSAFGGIESGRAGIAEIRAGLLTVRVVRAALEALPPRRFAPGRGAAVLLATALLHALVVAMLLTRAGDSSDSPPRDAARDRLLRALIQRHPSAAPPAAPQPPDAPPSGERGGSAPLDAERAREVPSVWRVRSAHATTAATTAADPVAHRGVFVDVMDAHMRRTLASVHATFSAMGTHPVDPAPDPDRADAYPGMGRVGIGAHSGCLNPEDCRTVALGSVRTHVDRPRAERLARQAFVQRESAAPSLAAAPPIAGVMTMDDVRRVVRHDVLADVVRCYAQRAEQATIPSGRVVVRFAIDPSGRVNTPTVLSSAVNDVATHTCITTVLRRFVFPPSSNGVEVTYPFVFSSFAPES